MGLDSQGKNSRKFDDFKIEEIVPCMKKSRNYLEGRWYVRVPSPILFAPTSPLDPLRIGLKAPGSSDSHHPDVIF
jgi:hypothetical protein